MIPKNLMKTFYLLLLATLGTIWPWILANGQQSGQYCDKVHVSATFTFEGNKPSVTCNMELSCPQYSNCQSSNNQTPVQAPTLSMTCSQNTQNNPTSCTPTTTPNPTQNIYVPSSNTLKSGETFNPASPCNCDSIILGPTLSSTQANHCTGNRVFGAGRNTVTSYTVQTSPSPECPEQP